MPSFSVKALSEATWQDFATLIERHNGVWGGCWCLEFHEEGVGRDKTSDQRRAAKALRVREDRAHAALVYHGDSCVGWCQFGSAEELPRVKNRRAYQEGLQALPDWRITCFFVDKAYRGKGVASTALAGALREIERLGGGTVESYPEDVEPGLRSSSFLHNGTVLMFERQGFVRNRRIGQRRWVVTKTVLREG